MDATVGVLGQLRERMSDVKLEDDSKVFNTELTAALELDNMLMVAEALAVSAAHRKESRGAHTRRDATTRDDQNYLYHTLCYHDAAGPRLDKKGVTLGTWVPEERKY
jgi:succinate dehydrogenase/fumarate reductase flavoprotein subunit